jgi:SAM-dependent methyltransferase/glycosyltransferase involved in cell wall biosynthesis
MTNFGIERERQKWDRHYASAAPVDEDAAMSPFHAELVERISQLIPAGSHILEAGCGAGWQSLALARTGRFDITLLDFSERALEQARTTFKREGIPAEFLLADACDPGEPLFDLVFNAGVLEHYSATEQVALLRGMASRSRKHVLALVPNRNCYWYWLWRIQQAAQGDWPYGKETPSTDLEAIFREAGLEFVGSAFFGSSWTESFISGLNFEPPMRSMLLEIHRSGLIDPGQKSYLVAGLGNINSHSQSGSVAPRGWVRSPEIDADRENALAAAVADALALRVGAEGRLASLTRQVADQDYKLEFQSKELEDKKRAITELDHTIHSRMEEIAKLHRTVQTQAEEINAATERNADLQIEVASLQSTVTQTRSELDALGSELERSRVETAHVRSEFNKVLALRTYRAMEPLRRAYWHGKQAAQRVRWLTWKTLRTIGPKVPTSRLKWAARRVLLRQELQRDSKPWNAELERILSEHRHVKGVVIYPPTLDWQFMFQRPQQLARSLARAGYLFFFCTDNTRIDHVEGFERREENLFVCHVPWKTFALVPGPVVLVSWAVHRPLLELLEQPTIIYDCLDDLEVGATPPEEHARLLTEANIVLATSNLLFERIRIQRPDVIFCPNGVDYESFARARAPGPVPQDLQPILRSGKKIVGYHGALARWFDYELLKSVSRAMKDLSFVLLGVDYDGTLQRSGIRELPNVHWLGMKPYAELPDYLRWFSAGTLPFLINSITEATSPIKLWEYLGAGIPLVSTDLPMCRGIEGVTVARGVTEFCTSIEAAIDAGRDDAFRDGLQKAARENTWDSRATQIVAALRRCSHKLPS